MSKSAIITGSFRIVEIQIDGEMRHRFENSEGNEMHMVKVIAYNPKKGKT